MPNESCRMFLCCPKCGNKYLLSTTETKTQTHGKNYSAGQGCLGFLLFGPLGLLCGGCGKSQQTTVTNTTYWRCPNCGYKFEDPDVIRKKIDSCNSPIFTMAMSITGLFLAICLYMIFSGIDKSVAMLPAWCALVFSVLIGVLIDVARRADGKKMQKKLNELENEMKKFHNE